MIDPALNSELKAGNQMGYEKLYMLTSARLKRYCSIFLKDDVLVEDMVQNSYVRLWEKRDHIQSGKSVENLLYTITRNQCLNYLRDQKLAAASVSIDEYNWSELQHLYQIDFTGGEEKPIEEQVLEALQEAISQLPARQNQVLVMCKIKGMKQKDVAEELGISVKAVEKNLDKAKHHLRETLMRRFPELAVLISLLIK